MARIIKKGLALSLGLVLFLAFYPVRLAQYFYAKLSSVNLGHSGSVITEVFAETLSTAEEALRVLLPCEAKVKEEVKTLTAAQKEAIAKAAAVEFDPELDKEYHFYVAESDGAAVGYALKDAGKGKHGPIEYMVGFGLDGKIKDVVILGFKEMRGKPVKGRKFLNQFIGKAAADPIALKKDIKGVAGATISSAGLTNGIRKSVYVFNELYKK